MAEVKDEAQRYAVVTGANKGIGFEICRQLASNGVMVVLTARNQKRGDEAIEKLKGFGFSDHVVFHQLDVADPSSIACLVEFVKAQFGRLDILVNNAGIGGVTISGDISFIEEMILEDEAKAFGVNHGGSDEAQFKSKGTLIETCESAEECLQTNYYGAKRMIESFILLLQLSESPRVVNVSSFMGKLKLIPNEWARGILSDGENLTEERVDEVLNRFLNDLKNGSPPQVKGWPLYAAAYKLSKAAMNAYTRIAAKKNPSLLVNCVCPGFVKTDMTCYTGKFTAEEGAEGPVMLALLPSNDLSGLCFDCKKPSFF